MADCRERVIWEVVKEAQASMKHIGEPDSGKPILSSELCPGQPLAQVTSPGAYKKYLDHYNIPLPHSKEVFESGYATFKKNVEQLVLQLPGIEARPQVPSGPGLDWDRSAVKNFGVLLDDKTVLPGCVPAPKKVMYFH